VPATSQGLIFYEPLDPVTVKDKPEPIPVWRVVSSRSRFGVDVDMAPKTPFIGRDYDPYYSWFRRYEELGLDGLRDRSKRPKVSPSPPRPKSSPRSSTSIPTTTSAPTADTGRSKGTKRVPRSHGASHEKRVSESALVTRQGSRREGEAPFQGKPTLHRGLDPPPAPPWRRLRRRPRDLPHKYVAAQTRLTSRRLRSSTWVKGSGCSGPSLAGRDRRPRYGESTTRAIASLVD
jgi:hypothetical protein